MPDSQLSPTPPTMDPDFKFPIPYFPIPNVETLRFLMERERAAADLVNETVKGFLEPKAALCNPDGSPINRVALALNEKLTAWMKELLPQPTAAEEWAASPTFHAKDGNIGVTSWALAFMVYQEFARVIVQRSLRGFINTMDFAVISGMNALHHGRLPFDAYKQGYTAKKATPDGTPILEDPQAFWPELQRLQEALVVFLRIKGLITEEEGSVAKLTMEGVRLLDHLTSVLGCTESMSAQGPALVAPLVEATHTPESKPLAEVQSDLASTKKEN